jgi:hypothetical protein
MPLQQLTEYFNVRFEREHGSSYRPFVLRDEKVSGIFGPVRIDSVFSPIRKTLKPTLICGHTTQIEVSSQAALPLYENEIENLLAEAQIAKHSGTQLDSFIHFGRLARTVHMLNYLRLLPMQGALFLEVDPRHILGIKHDHGVYFGEIIAQCGLKNQDVAIVLPLYRQYSRYYEQLLDGLNNYRRENYRIALRFSHSHVDDNFLKLIKDFKPNFVNISTKYFDADDPTGLTESLHKLTYTVNSIGGETILSDIDQKCLHDQARAMGSDFVEGSYYKAIAFDYLKLETPSAQVSTKHLSQRF